MPSLGRRRRGAKDAADGPQNKRRRRFEQYAPTLPAIPGTALVCGQGDMGQLGLGEDEASERKRPALLDVKDVVSVCAGGMHTVLLDKNGVVHTFGCNDEGALGRDTSGDSEFLPGRVGLPGKVVLISAGDSHTACLLQDGRIFAWGSFRDSHGNMGLTLDGNKRAPVQLMTDTRHCCSIASGSDHLAMLTSQGTMFTVGCGEQGQLGRVSLRSASGEGRHGKQELLRPAQVKLRTGKPIDAIWATNYCTFAREAGSGLIWAFGLNNYKQLTYKKDGDTAIRPVKTKLADVKQIAGGPHHTLVLKNDGTCHVIGRHDYGRLGLGNINSDVAELTQITALSGKKIETIACGEAQSFALTHDGKLYAWGMGSNHQLGTGSEDDALEPVLIESKQTQGKHILSASSGGQHSVFIAAEKEQVLAASLKPRGARAVPVKAAATTTTTDEGEDKPVTSTATKTAAQRKASSPPT